MTINFFSSKVFSVAFLYLLTNFSIPKAFAAIAKIPESYVSDQASEWIADITGEQHGHPGDSRWIKCNTEREGQGIPIHSRRNPNEGEVIAFLSIGQRVKLEEHSGPNYIQISEPVEGYIEANELDDERINIEECNRRIYPPRDSNQENQSNQRTYQIIAEITLSLYSSPGFNPSNRVRRMNNGRFITLESGDEVEVINTTVFNDDGRPLERGEDPLNDGWVNVLVNRSGINYSGYVRYQNVNFDSQGSGGFVIPDSSTDRDGSLPYYCLENNRNWQESLLPVFSDYGSFLFNLQVNQRVLKTGRKSQYNDYEWVQIEITDGFGGKLTGWVVNRPLYGQNSNIENLQPC